MKHEEILQQINQNYKIVERFMGGMSNFTYKIKDNNNVNYVFRYPGKGNYNFVDYSQEKEHLKAIEKLNISNKVIYLDSVQGLKIATYVVGENIKETVDLVQISNILKKLHQANIELAKYDHLGRLIKYEKLHTNKVEKYVDLKKSWLEIYEKYLKQHLKYPTHNDAQMANFIITPNQEIKLLDWEFTGINDYIYDIACFGNSNFQMAKNLLQVYEVELTTDKMIRLFAWRMFQCLQWFNVASYKEEIGLSKDLGIDFQLVSKKYLSLAEEFLQEVNQLTI
ncbi:MAG: choline/ethanolamine kinase family protein [Mycoplasmatales bacterium]